MIDVAALALFFVLAFLFQYEYQRIRRYGGGVRDLAAFSVMMGLASALGIAVALDLPVPNPVNWITAIFGPVAELILPQVE